MSIKRCPVCNQLKLISTNLIACAECIKSNRNNILDKILKVHMKSRKEFSLPPVIPKDASNSLTCKICGNECRIRENEFGFCGLRTNKNNKLISVFGTARKGLLDWYFDTLPTNCVADWVCEGSKHPGMKNLAVFYRSCSFNCLFCQNWHFKETSLSKSTTQILSAEELSNCIDNKTFCICYFGGDPSTQMPHAIATSRLIQKTHPNIRICFETNGNINRNLLKLVIELCLNSGGCIKFDLKAFNKNLHYALCGTDNTCTLKNFEFVGKYIYNRPEPPLLVASSLIIPGYIDSDEIYKIASFIAKIDTSIPYSLLGFYPHFYLHDLPTTSKSQMLECVEAAKSAGLSRVHVGNIHLLDYIDYDNSPFYQRKT